MKAPYIDKFPLEFEATDKDGNTLIQTTVYSIDEWFELWNKYKNIELKGEKL